MNPFFLGGQELLAMHRSGQILILPYASLKQREKMSEEHFLFCMAATYLPKNQNGFINKKKRKESPSVFSFSQYLGSLFRITNK